MLVTILSLLAIILGINLLLNVGEYDRGYRAGMKKCSEIYNRHLLEMKWDREWDAWKKDLHQLAERLNKYE